MSVSQHFDEIRVYGGFAERTGALVERANVRHSDRRCSSVSVLTRKARAAGDGIFYLALNVWPEDAERVELQKRWIVMPGLSAGRSERE